MQHKINFTQLQTINKFVSIFYSSVLFITLRTIKLQQQRNEKGYKTRQDTDAIDKSQDRVGGEMRPETFYEPFTNEKIDKNFL